MFESHDEVVHRVPMCCLLDRDAGDSSLLSGGVSLTQESGEIVGDYRVFECEAGSSGKFGRCCSMLRGCGSQRVLASLSIGKIRTFSRARSFTARGRHEVQSAQERLSPGHSVLPAFGDRRLSGGTSAGC